MAHDTLGMRRITSYFSPVAKKKQDATVTYCFSSCLHGRADEEKGPMILCDGYANWFHEECVDNKQEKWPRPEIEHAAWFCSSCFSVFKEIKNIKLEVMELKTQLKALLSATQKKAVTDSKHSGTQVTENELGNSTDQKKSTLLDDDLELTFGISSNYSVEVERLQVENKMLKDHLSSLNKLMDHVLDHQNDGAASNLGQKATRSQSSQVSHSSQSNKPPQRKKSKGSHSGNTNKNVNNNHGNNLNKSENDSNIKKTIIIGDSHVKRLYNQQIHNTKANGIGGLQSYQLISRQASFVNKEIDSVDEIIIHAGCNDIKSRSPKAIVNSIEFAVKSIFWL